jgi:hypothetical protein
MAVELANEIWSEIKRYINSMDKAEAAEVLVGILVDNDVGTDEIRSAFKNDSDVKQALKQYLVNHELNEDDEDEDEDSHDDEDEYEDY